MEFRPSSMHQFLDTPSVGDPLVSTRGEVYQLQLGQSISIIMMRRMSKGKPHTSRVP